MNELKLFLKNFQSISEGELVFMTGLNFIVGQSNSGKSATFRALKACLLNPKGSQRFVKKGNNKSIVTLLYNGNEVTWERTNKESSYYINGQQYIKTGSSDAFKILMNDTGFVKDEREGALMNIEEELQLPFPFGTSKTDLFKLFENIFCVSDSAVILKAAKEQEEAIKDNIEALELDKIKIESKLEHLKEFKESLDLDRLRDYKDYLEQTENKIGALKNGLPEIKKALRISEANLEVKERGFNNLLSLYFEACNLKKTIIRSKKLHRLNKSLQELKIEENDLKGEYEDLLSLKITLHKLINLNKIKVEEKSFTSNLETLLELKSLQKFLKETLPEQLKSLEEDQKREEERILGIEAKLKSFKVCPLCHRPLKNEEKEKC